MSEVARADTIVAIATAPGAGAIGVIRLSGADAVRVASTLIALKRGGALAPRHLHLAELIDPASGAPLDSALVVHMPAPRSYTGEEVVELSCHGNPVLLADIVRRLIAAGARLAEPGEFTRRAYLRGRLDLVQAEAVAELIGARSERAARLAMRQLRGGVSACIEGLRDALLDVIAGLEVALDFPEDEIGLSRAASVKRCRDLVARLDALIEGTRHGRSVRDGLLVMLAGRPNVGKSSLLNALLGQDRAIVSSTPGTTRDLVEGTLSVNGLSLRIVDGAGLGPPGDAIDAEAMRRSRNALQDSDLVLVVLDRSRPLDEADREVLHLTAGAERVVVANKSDLPSGWSGGEPSDRACSALTGAGVAELKALLEQWVDRRAGIDADEGGVVASLRVSEHLHVARAGLARSAAAFELNVPTEAVLVDLREALLALEHTLGGDAADAVLDRIFSNFCVGK